MTLALFLRVFLVLGLAWLGLTSRAPAHAQDCQYVLGFASLYNRIPDVVGQCVTNETYDAAGNAYQQTTNGVLRWHKADNVTAFINGYQTWVNGPNGIEVRLSTQRFDWEPNPDGLPVVASHPAAAASTYLDDRSSPYALMRSLVNALNRKEYVRAYAYWEPGAPQRPPFPRFQQGYANTQSVQLALGSATMDAGAGNVYSAVPVTLVARVSGGGTQTFVGCYVLHLAQLAIQGTPPFQSWGIRSASVRQVLNTADTGRFMAQACDGQGGALLPPQSPADPSDVSANRYLDDRSTAQQLLRSLVNAVNRKEYVRAYAYWEPSAPQRPPFPQFEQGYADTQMVHLTLGAVSSEAGAGSVYYRVPVTLVAQTSRNGTQTFVGCYQLRLANPAIQGAPPFQPLAIQSANVRQVANNAETARLMSESCQAQQE